MSDFFADQTSEVEVTFPEDGVTVWMRRYITAGMQEHISNESVRVQLNTPRRDGQKRQEIREGYIRAGHFSMLQQMITRVDVPTGESKPHVPVSNTFLSRLKPEAVRRLLDVIEENNPLSDWEPEEMKTAE